MNKRHLAGLAIGLCMLCAILTGLTSGVASANIVVDQSNGWNGPFIYNSIYTTDPDTYFSQSFKPSMNNAAGGYVEIFPWDYPDVVTMTLWDINPAIDSTHPLAGGTTTITQGGGVSIYWDPVPVTPGNEYFLRLQTSGSLQQTNESGGNQYADGALYVGTQVWWGGGYHDWDLVFKTYSDSNYAVPEPSSLIALGALMSPILALRRRKA